MLPREGHLKTVKKILSYLKTFPRVTSTYGSELVASRISTELILEIRCILWSLRAALDGPALMLEDNMSVVLNTTVLSSILKKKHNVIAYH
jgi:hypothetical protein